MILSFYNVQYTEYLNGHSQFKWPQRNLCVAFVRYHTAHWLAPHHLKVKCEITQREKFCVQCRLKRHIQGNVRNKISIS